MTSPTAHNMPILWQNCLTMFRTEIGKKAWIWFAENRSSWPHYDADDFAREVEHLYLTIRPMLDAAASNFPDHLRADTETLDDLTRFILKRHANWRLGGNISPTYLGPES